MDVLLINLLNFLTQPGRQRLRQPDVEHQPGKATADGGDRLPGVFAFPYGDPGSFFRLAAGSPELDRMQQRVRRKVPRLALKAQVVRMMMGDSKGTCANTRLLRMRQATGVMRQTMGQHGIGCGECDLQTPGRQAIPE